jgi:ribosomal protein L29
LTEIAELLRSFPAHQIEWIMNRAAGDIEKAAEEIAELKAEIARLRNLLDLCGVGY